MYSCGDEDACLYICVCVCLNGLEVYVLRAGTVRKERAIKNKGSLARPRLAPFIFLFLYSIEAQHLFLLLLPLLWRRRRMGRGGRREGGRRGRVSRRRRKEDQEETGACRNRCVLLGWEWGLVGQSACCSVHIKRRTTTRTSLSLLLSRAKLNVNEEQRRRRPPPPVASLARSLPTTPCVSCCCYCRRAAGKSGVDGIGSV